MTNGENCSAVLDEALEKGQSFEFNRHGKKAEDLLKAGVIDPAKVVKSSLSHAVSMARIVLLSEALIANAKEDEETA